jgi:hypothetical protein
MCTMQLARVAIIHGMRITEGEAENITSVTKIL